MTEENHKPTTTQKILAAIEPLIYARRKLTMGILLVLTVWFAWEAGHIRRDAGFDKSIPLEHQYMQVLKQYMAEFGGANTVLVALIQKDGKGDMYNEAFLTSLKTATDEVFFLPGIDRSRVSSLFTPDVRYIEVVEGGFAGGNVIPAEYAPNPEMFALVRANVGKGGHVGRYTTKSQNGAMIYSELLEVDPVTGEKLDYAVVSKLLEDKIRGRFTNPKKYVYKLKAAQDGLAAGAVVGEGFVDLGWKLRLETFEVNGPAKDDGSAPDRIKVKGSDVAVEFIDNPQYNPDINVHVIGFAKVVGDVIDATMQVVLFLILTLFMTFLLLWLYTGSMKLAVLPLVCAVTAVIWEFGLLQMAGKGLDPFAILVPFLIIAISVSHGVQYVNAWVGEITLFKRNSFDASLYTWRRLAVYGTMAIMTGFVGFALIAVIPIDIIREMALNASLGMFAILVTNKIMMPIWLTWIDIGDPEAFRQKQEQRDSVLDPIWEFISNVVRPTPAIIAILAAAALYGWSFWKGEGLQVGDSQDGVPELLPDSRYNQDTNAIGRNFAIGTDIMKVIAEMDAEACVRHDMMDQVDRFGWRMENTEGVQSILSLPWAARQVNAAFSEATPKFKVLPRNQYTMVQAITPIPTSSGLLNSNCSALAIFVFTQNHRASTLERIVHEVGTFNKENAAEFYEVNKDVNEGYCAEKLEKRRDAGRTRIAREKHIEAMRKKDKTLTDEKIDTNPKVIELTKAADAAAEAHKAMDKACPVNFALASGNVGVMAATNEEVHRLEKPILYVVYAGIIICVFLSFFEWQSLVAIMLPLSLVSWMAYAVMTILGIGMKVAILPVVALAAGVGVDYGIYVYATYADALAAGFKSREAYLKTLKLTGKAVIFTGITLSLGVLTWLWSGLQFQRDMGKLLVFMFTTNMIGAIVLLPAIASFILKPKELAPGEEPVFKPRH
ncbi:RND family transporter [Solimonas sp. SE-A11]|uniref:efflux RND transporter permease subunit n=1 Tax=Solimonas sp. SE-A11 TaxID=3054954 RepID=UPI00259CFF8A|nr:MMPL family transporter [Solimonas sp. SE-A11]MDM4772451.1 MMPL family transporter [Solimonas sp. SE-A11]